MLHYKNRNNSIHILTIDSTLVEDIYERLRDYPGMESVGLIKPGNGHSTITPEDILKSSQDTMTSRVLIFDVRSQTKPILQRAYSDIVRFNRPDFNQYCYSVLIGDGPLNPPDNEKGLYAIGKYLSDARGDYNPAVYFVNLFLYYSFEELQEIATYHNNALPEEIPHILGKFFKENKIHTSQAYKYFRAANTEDSSRRQKKKERQSLLKALFFKMLSIEYPENKKILFNSFSKEGSSLPGEALKFNIYPFFFEEWVLDLLRKAKSAT